VQAGFDAGNQAVNRIFDRARIVVSRKSGSDERERQEKYLALPPRYGYANGITDWRDRLSRIRLIDSLNGKQVGGNMSSGEQQVRNSELVCAEDAAVRRRLDAILCSHTFYGARRQQKLLRHLVEERLAGRENLLKEYTVGVVVFERGEAFDPRIDPIVRVEASRLRSRLEKYYESEGDDSDLRIQLPRGSYIPVISSRPAVPVAGVAPPVAEVRRVPKIEWALVVAAIALASATWLFVVRPTTASAPLAAQFERATFEAGEDAFPSLSPDGQFLAYARRSDQQSWHLHLRHIREASSIDLSGNCRCNDTQPAFAPDGRHIAFRSDRSGGGLFLMDSMGGALRKIADSGFHPSWSPDGLRLVFSSEGFTDPNDRPNHRSSLLLLDTRTGAVRALTTNSVVPDAIQPAWSPHGRRIAFWGVDFSGQRDLWTIPAGGDSKTMRGTAVTHDASSLWSPAWSTDGRYLYFSSDRGGSMNLWRVRIDEDTGAVGGKPEAVVTPSSYIGWLSIAHERDLMAYTRHLISSNVYRVAFDPKSEKTMGSPVPITRGNLRFREPDLSPDGHWLAVRVEDPQEDIAIMRVDGSDFRRLTNDVFKDRSPRWSPDGSTILFLTNRGGAWELWTVRPDGGGLRQMTHGGSLPGIWSPDAGQIAYSFPRVPVVSRVNGAGMSDMTTLAALPGSHDRSFQPEAWSPDGTLLAGRTTPRDNPEDRVLVYDLAEGVYHDAAPMGSGPVWMSDSRRLLFRHGNEILLVDTVSRRTRRVLADFEGGLYNRFALTHDNRAIYFVINQTEVDIWLTSSK
jgi:eukaryotic-like serine/threonine-protein kinase